MTLFCTCADEAALHWDKTINPSRSILSTLTMIGSPGSEAEVFPHHLLPDPLSGDVGDRSWDLWGTPLELTLSSFKFSGSGTAGNPVVH